MFPVFLFFYCEKFQTHRNRLELTQLMDNVVSTVPLALYVFLLHDYFYMYVNFLMTFTINGNSLQYSCLENATDREAWQAIVHGVTQRQRWLSASNVRGKYTNHKRTTQWTSASSHVISKPLRCIISPTYFILKDFFVVVKNAALRFICKQTLW